MKFQGHTRGQLCTELAENEQPRGSEPARELDRFAFVERTREHCPTLCIIGKRARARVLIEDDRGRAMSRAQARRAKERDDHRRQPPAQCVGSSTTALVGREVEQIEGDLVARTGDQSLVIHGCASCPFVVEVWKELVRKTNPHRF